MASMTVNINNMLNNLEEEDYNTVINFIEYLSAARKQKRTQESIAALSEIQSMFTDNKGWTSEEDMIADMAAFRKERMGL